MLLGVINKSKVMPDADVAKAVRACATQNKLHVAPYWDMVPAAIVFYEDEERVPSGAELLVILDDNGAASALGFHRVTPRGNPYLRAFVDPVLNHGGTLLSGSLSVSSVMSHEVCEWFVDRFLNLWADGPDGSYAVEICDPVQDDSYEIEGVAVSNFVTKRFYDSKPKRNTRYDYLGKIKKPFTMTEGGFMQVRKAGKVENIFGARFPDWQKTPKKFPAARSFQRAEGHAGER